MSFSLTVLGSSSAVPTSGRFPAAHVLNVHERYFLIDCGEGTQIQLRRYRFRFGKINHIFITHLHGDHIFGLFGLISTLSLLGKTTDLHIYANPKLEKIMEVVQPYFFEHPLPFKIVFHPTGSSKQQTIFEDEMVIVKTIPLKHRIPTTGFLFREKKRPLNIKKEAIEFYDIPVRKIQSIKSGSDFTTAERKIIPNHKLTLPPWKQRSLAYCSDTAYSERIIKYIENVDILYHEATYGSDMKERAHETFHSTAGEAAMLAKKANVEKLIIGHFSARYKSVAPLLEEAREIFPETFAAEEGEIHSVVQKRIKRGDQ